MNELSLIQLIVDASLLVQMVLLLLLLISIYSWVLIFRKSRFLKKAHWAADEFEYRFLKENNDLNMLYTRTSSYDQDPTGMAHIFSMGYTEFVKLRKQSNIVASALLEGTQRAMRVAMHREVNELDTHLAALATIGSVSPYIGLFGTVWGIMNSFNALGGIQQVTLAMVAPGISEALIATAMGLIAAIPAVMAYNHYVDDVDRLTVRYNTFLDEFTGILQRQAYHHTAISYQTMTTENVAVHPSFIQEDEEKKGIFAKGLED